MSKKTRQARQAANTPAPATANTKAKVEEAVKEAVATVPVARTPRIGQTNTLHGVKVDGKEYQSVWAAWQALNIGGSRGRHIKFRTQLKGTPGLKLTYVRPEDGKKFDFEAFVRSGAPAAPAPAPAAKK
jgi:hypothetical protein